MNKEIKAKWMEALRSGEYKQGKGALRRSDNTFCCLGVLCDIHSKETGIEWKSEDDWDFKYIGRIGGLPTQVQNWAGIKDDCGEYKGGILTLDNDRGGKSFKEIANIIEANF